MSHIGGSCFHAEPFHGMKKQIAELPCGLLRTAAPIRQPGDPCACFGNLAIRPTA